ncbi:MAG: magnesium-chelatase subunit [Pseudomonadota bacterium]
MSESSNSPEHDSEAPSTWSLAVHAAALLAIDPIGLAGARIHAGAGPVRDAWMSLLQTLMGDSAWKRMPVNITDERLLGGLDLSATLSAGRPILQQGVLADVNGGTLILAMAERLPSATGAKLAQVMDSGEIHIVRDGIDQRRDSRFAVIALDEGVSEEEVLLPGLRDRLAFDLDLRSVSWQEVRDYPANLISQQEIAAARARLPEVNINDDLLDALCGTAMALGVDSARATLMTLSAARANAALNSDLEVGGDDVRAAAELVLAPRATRLPPVSQPEPSSEQAQENQQEPDQEPDQEPPPPEDDSQQPDPDPSTEQNPQALEDQILEATKAAIPAGLLSQLLAGGLQRRASSGKSGAAVKGGLRGRPSGSRRAMPAHGSRLHLMDTLRAAAPWQKIRKATVKNKQAKIQVRAEDFHVARIKQKTATTTLFVVDASGSSALNRLAEAKGAVELLLADCYVRRDQVALIAFRGKQAELLLPPTRSLVRAKRSLSGLPGGGGTPLATAIDTAASVAEGLQRRGITPVIVLLTDGRANVARSGSGGRELAYSEAMEAARQLAVMHMSVLFIDTSPQPQKPAADLAAAMRARYLPLPFAGAASVSLAVRAAALDGAR